jgi:hypothetical protein
LQFIPGPIKITRTKFTRIVPRSVLVEGWAFNYYVTQFMRFAREYEMSEGLTLGIQIDQIERTAQKRLSGSSFSWWDQESRTVEPGAAERHF